ncbi:MAG TPA: hypothetical protein DIT28_00740 [Oxalobacteraceae bacterium]|nr:hypothetical protein [Oxalobacteraceae bacterium]
MQQAIVYLIVAYAAWAVGRRYAPLSWRRRASAWLHARFSALGWMRIADKFLPRANAGTSCSDGCSSCSRCPPSDKAAPGNESTVTPDALRRTIRR